MATKRETDVLSDIRGVLPQTAAVSAEGHLLIGGCDAVDLAREFGTPLYVFDEEDLRSRCREFLREFQSRHADTGVLYAAKAYFGPAMAALIAEEGLGLDVVSGGELAAALAGGFPPERIYLHGNNKSARELREAVEAGVGRIVLDNFHELALIRDIAAGREAPLSVMLRVTPGVDPHTHAFISTGGVDSKFGFPMAGGAAEEALVEALAIPGIDVVGLHCHIGSQITELEPHAKAVSIVLDFAARMAERHGLDLREFSAGGGYPVQYQRGAPPPPIGEFAERIVAALKEGWPRRDLPRLTVEPGRAIVARAGVALYTVGATKDVPGVRKFVSVDGGMADNIRPALYEARYEVLVANRLPEPPRETVTIAGRYCESGDILVRDASLPHVWAGDVLALPASGAYCIPMASNYNWATRPAVVFVRDGRARLVRRRETYDDLLRPELNPFRAPDP